MQLSSGAKGWLWFLFICNIIGVVFNLLGIILTGVFGVISVISSILLIAGIAIMLFQQKKLGFYLMCAAAAVSFVMNLLTGANIILAIISAVLCPLITYLVLKNQWNQMG